MTSVHQIVVGGSRDRLGSCAFFSSRRLPSAQPALPGVCYSVAGSICAASQADMGAVDSQGGGAAPAFAVGLGQEKLARSR